MGSLILLLGPEYPTVLRAAKQRALVSMADGAKPGQGHRATWAIPGAGHAKRRALPSHR